MSTNSMRIQNGTMSYVGKAVAGRRRILTTPVGLRFPAEVTFNDWARMGALVVRVADSSAWCLGDWLVFGRGHYAKRYRTAVAAAGLDYQTLRNYAWIAGRFEWSRRRPELSFQHHAEVASLTEDEQDRWLAQAVRRKWSRNELRRAVREARQEGGPADTERPTEALPRIRVSAESAERWRRAAERSSVDFEHWMVETLDEEALRALTDPDH